MHIILDTHVHLYPCYDRAVALCTLAASLRGLAGDAVRVGLLTERYDSDAFCALREGGAGTCGVEPLGNDALRISVPGEDQPIYLVAGWQVVTSERIEVLALCAEDRIEDGCPAGEVIERIHAGGGVPALSWSPGKWLGARGKLIRGILDRHSPGQLVLGDTSLRPFGMPEPSLLRYARRRGYAVVAGTDALPFAGEARLLGTYGSSVDGDFVPDDPAGSIRSLLANESVRWDMLGKRSRLPTVAVRLWRNRLAKRH